MRPAPTVVVVHSLWVAGIVREERRKAAFAKVEKQKGEEQRLLAVVAKWENVDRSKAAVALKAPDAYYTYYTHDTHYTHYTHYTYYASYTYYTYNTCYTYYAYYAYYTDYTYYTHYT